MPSRWLLLVLLVFILPGCANFGYYLQAARGQFELWRLERPIAEVIADARAPERVRERLRAVGEIRDFASRELALPDNESYRRYADLRRPYVVWNVFATAEFSLEPVQWCFPFAGCVGYRGYFARDDAQRFARGLAQTGQDVFLGGVPAYSTLGYFPDPVLNTFIHYPEVELARLIFHELAHQVLYVKDDSVFNESFAVAVEREGVRRWLESAGTDRDRSIFDAMQQRRMEFAALIDRYRSRLQQLYASGVAVEVMRSRKRELLLAMRADYDGLKERWGGFRGYDRWFEQESGNALFAAIAIYTEQVPAFQVLLERQGRDLPRFYAAVRELARLAPDERRRQLAALVSSQVCLRNNDPDPASNEFKGGSSC